MTTHARNIGDENAEISRSQRIRRPRRISRCSADCTNASVAAYQLAGFSCTVAGLTFSDFSVSLDQDGSGAAVLGNIYPVTLGDRRGLVLNYSAVADSGGTATLFFAYKVAGQSISDALAVITGVTADGGLSTSR